MSFFWKKVNRLLQEQERSYAWLAKKLGVARNTVKSWAYKDRLPRADHALKIADVLGENAFYLITGKSEVSWEIEDPDVAVIYELVQHADKETIKIVKELLLSRVTKDHNS